MIEKNHTEEDTFDRLRKPRFEEMSRIHKEWWSGRTNDNTSLRIPFMEKHGWTWLEFVLEAKRRADYTSFSP